MNEKILFSEDFTPFSWLEAGSAKIYYGPKGAMLASIPRMWTLPFALIPASSVALLERVDDTAFISQGEIDRLFGLASIDGKVIVRSSVIGETIWDRGTYESVVLDTKISAFRPALMQAVLEVVRSAAGKQIGLVIQRYEKPKARGEFGNLLRVSKTRDHWELTTNASDTVTRTRLNTQRDEAADPENPLVIRPRQPSERLFGSVAAWLNNDLIRGRSQRLSCEWVTDNRRVFIVQVDEEDEDFVGINPLQVRVSPAHQPKHGKGVLLKPADSRSINDWDKLLVLRELWEEDAIHKPTLFYIPFSDVITGNKRYNFDLLSIDFEALIGPDNIVVRTSVKAGHEKINNLPRTEGFSPADAARWCIEQAHRMVCEGHSSAQLAFVAHRFIAARASAWVRAEPANPVVEIHSLWGLPDALQYCPYDIWEIHVPTETATEFTEYKSNILVSHPNGRWEYARVKNELARSLSIGRREAVDLANRTRAIADRLGRACHVMWFVGCIDNKGTNFSLPWYWTEAHDADKNIDRSNFKIFRIASHQDIYLFCASTQNRLRVALELKPINIDLMRDKDFLGAVGAAAIGSNVPIILAGSTLAHAYFQLRKIGATVIALGEKEHTRVRRSVNFGKLVRDKIPNRIAARREADITRKVPSSLKKSFLISKLLEEALEIRTAIGDMQKTAEMADLFEVLRGLAQSEGISIDDVISTADQKREMVGGFTEGLVLMQTGILGSKKDSILDSERPLTQLLARRVSGSAFELPFSFFGFMEVDQARSLILDDLGVRIDVTLKMDRIELQASREAEQLQLPLDLLFEQDDQME